MQGEDIYSSLINMYDARMVRSTNASDASFCFGNNVLVPSDEAAADPHLTGKTLRVVDGQLFVVDPGSPPSSDNQ